MIDDRRLAEIEEQRKEGLGAFEKGFTKRGWEDIMHLVEHAIPELCAELRAQRAADIHLRTELIKMAWKKDAAIEVLQALYDEQAGPPLERRAEQWAAAMMRATALLGEQEEKP